MHDISVAVVAATAGERARIAQQLSDFFGLNILVKTETHDTVSQLGVHAGIPGSSKHNPCLLAAGPQGQDPAVIPLRYNLTKESWHAIMKAAKFLRGARVAVTATTANVAMEIAETIRCLGINGLRVKPVSVSTLRGCRFDFILVADPRLEPIAAHAGRVIKLELLLSPSVIVDLLCRYGQYDEAAKSKMAQYLVNVKLVSDDYLDLLDLAHNKTRHVAPSNNVGHGRKRKLCPRAKYTLDDAIGKSPALNKAKAMVAQLASSTSSVIIYGETGTGKEMFANAIHATSPLGDKCFLTVNCAAIPETLAESELFGYEEGAFTGAKKGGKAGLFEHADGGTIFLDEINNLSLETQARLLRVLEDGTLLRVGGRELINVEVRIIAACSKPLEEFVKLGRFREDLYYRICVIPIYLPPLRERVGDIPLLIRHFLAEMGETRSLSPVTWERIKAYHWPGNIRELKHCLEYMRTVTDDLMELDMLPPHIGQNRILTASNRTGTSGLVQSFEQQSTQRAGKRRAGEYEQDRESGQITAPVESYLAEEDIFLLGIIKHFNALGHGIGRRCLAREANRYGIPMAEGEIRTRLSFLRVMGFVKWGLGRSGVKLSGDGHQVLVEHHNR